MVFSSVTFLFFFLPITLGFVWFINSLISSKTGLQIQNIALLFLSIVFYSWGEPIYAIVMLFSIMVNYLLGRLMGGASTTQLRKLILISGITINLSSLIGLKYLGYFTDLINSLLELLDLSSVSTPEIPLPVGISFFTFQAMSYIIDVYRNQTEPQKNLLKLGLYISLFPQLIAGPIVRYHDIADQLSKRSLSFSGLSTGIRRFIIGLAKKALVANTMAVVADEIFSLPNSELTTPLAWIGVIAYTFQIYFDFSGYSDMAIGLGRMFGFKFLENFNYPYISQSIQEFWRRWHISLSRWFRDYLYIPLGGNKGSKIATYRNQFIVFALCGLWHGASTNFIFWGIYHGMFLTIEKLGLNILLEKVGKLPRHLYTLMVVMVGWVYFRAESFDQAVAFNLSLFGFAPLQNNQYLKYLSDPEFILVLLAAFIGSSRFLTNLLTGNSFKEARIRVLTKIGKTLRNPLAVITIIILTTICLAMVYSPETILINEDYITIDSHKSTIELIDKAVWLNTSLTEKILCLTFEGEIFVSEEGANNKALVMVRTFDRYGNKLPPIENLSFSKTVGSYRYLNTAKSGKFSLELYIPEDVRKIRLGFRGWRNKRNISISPNILVKSHRLRYIENQPTFLSRIVSSASITIPLFFAIIFILSWTLKNSKDPEEPLRIIEALLLIAVFLVSIIYISSGTYNPFIYFRF